MITIEHIKCPLVVSVFDNVASYDEMIDAIKSQGKEHGNGDQDRQNDFVGAAFEVYTEFWFKRYATACNTLLGIRDIKHTSNDKYHEGKDFDAIDIQTSTPVGIQSKFRSNPTQKLSRDDLQTFLDLRLTDVDGPAPCSKIFLFTNLEHCPTEQNSGGCFQRSDLIKKINGVLDRRQQSLYIDRDPTFWADLQAAMKASSVKPTYDAVPVMYPHQEKMIGAIRSMTGKNGRVICATGGGKTRVEYQAIHDGFFGANAGHDGVKPFIQILVAPRIDLLRQHSASFHEYGLFGKDGVVEVHFRTGSESRQKHTEYAQFTSRDELAETLATYYDRKILIFVTYASVAKLFSALGEEGRGSRLTVWDEFHHTVKQDKSWKDKLVSFPSDKNLFFSASEKDGRVLSSSDEAIYGPKLIDVSYKTLRDAGILVPKLVLKFIRLNKDSGRVAAIERSLRDAAKADGFDIKDATMEAASIAAAQDDHEACGKDVFNLVTFSRSVPICKAIVRSEAVREELGEHTLLQTVHSDVKSSARAITYESVKKSANSVLCQHSILVEGIDVTAFNSAILSRQMDVTATQQAIGRVVRAHPDDKREFQAGKLKVEDQSGWRKYSSTIYVIIHNDDSLTFKQLVVEMIEKLEGAGLGPKDILKEELESKKHGTKEDAPLTVSLASEVDLCGMSLNDYINNIVVEYEEEIAHGVQWDKVVTAKTVDLAGFSDLMVQEALSRFIDVNL